MDYEKKYKESMTKMSTFLAKHDGFTISKDGEMYKELSEIFPELKESEDEKIRKELLGFHKDAVQSLQLQEREDNIWSIEQHEKFITWLEKQGEQKQDPCEHCDNIKLNCTNFPCIKKVAFEQGKSVYDVINEKQGEQKPAEWSEEMGSLTLDAIGLIRAYGEDVKKNSQLGQKIARADAFLTDLYHEAFYPQTFNPRKDLRSVEWSEEDMHGLTNTIALIQGYKDSSLDDEYAQENCDYALTWLKSLRPQTNQEVNKKIDKIKTQIALSKGFNRENRDTIFALLDSIRPQKQWKPSEKQLKSIRDCALNANIGACTRLVLDSLYADLKKLREE